MARFEPTERTLFRRNAPGRQAVFRNKVRQQTQECRIRAGWRGPAQTARNVCMWLEDEGKEVSYLIKDGDRKLTAQFDGIIESTGAKVKKISRKAPEMNSFAESWVATIKRECLDRFMVLGGKHLEHIISTYLRYYNGLRPHRGLGNAPIGVGKPPEPEKTEIGGGVACDQWLGGLLKHYRKAA